MDRCNGAHRFFVAANGLLPGKVWVAIVCTACGEGLLKEFPVENWNKDQVPVAFEMSTGQLVIPTKN